MPTTRAVYLPGNAIENKKIINNSSNARFEKWPSDDVCRVFAKLNIWTGYFDSFLISFFFVYEFRRKKINRTLICTALYR